MRVSGINAVALHRPPCRFQAAIAASEDLYLSGMLSSQNGIEFVLIGDVASTHWWGSCITFLSHVRHDMAQTRR